MVVGASIGTAYVMGYIQGKIALVLGVVALVMVGTGAAGYCAMYKPLGMDTRENKD